MTVLVVNDFVCFMVSSNVYNSVLRILGVA